MGSFDPVGDVTPQSMLLQADTFGECAIPTIAWQIDPFGHSKEQVFKMMMMVNDD